MEITTERCRLEPVTAADQENVLRLYTDPEVRRFLGGALSLREAEEKIAGFSESAQEADGGGICAVRRKGDGAFLGSIYLSAYYDPGCYELSYTFLPEFWGKGYAFEAMQASLDYCREALGLKKIYAETQTENLRSRRLLERLGYRAEKELVRFGAVQTVYGIAL